VNGGPICAATLASFRRLASPMSLSSIHSRAEAPGIDHALSRDLRVRNAFASLCVGGSQHPVRTRCRPQFRPDLKPSNRPAHATVQRRSHGTAEAATVPLDFLACHIRVLRYSFDRERP